jgi:CRP-like cAMP-binding protein
MPDRRYHNWLLRAASASDLKALGAPFERVSFKIDETVIAADVAPDYIWFIERGFVAVHRRMRDGKSCEIGYAGNRGVFPVQALITADPLGLEFVAQRPTETYRVSADRLRAIAMKGSAPNLRLLFREAGRAAMDMMAMTAVCNKAHNGEQWVVRRLLAMSRDEARITMTEEFMAQMLGIARGTVCRVFVRLQTEGLIGLTRGTIEILDRAGLEAQACECYEAIEAVRRRLRMDVK